MLASTSGLDIQVVENLASWKTHYGQSMRCLKAEALQLLHVRYGFALCIARGHWYAADLQKALSWLFFPNTMPSGVVLGFFSPYTCISR